MARRLTVGTLAIGAALAAMVPVLPASAAPFTNLYVFGDSLTDTGNAHLGAIMLGLPSPAPVRVLPLHHQISQKLHACSEPGSKRAHDLVDLQLMAPMADAALVRQTAERLFAFRAAHPWPPTVVAGEGWEVRYADAAEGLVVLDLEAAVEWVNKYIASL